MTSLWFRSAWVRRYVITSLVPLTVLCGEGTAKSETTWVPNFGVSERYDTNVYYINKAALPSNVSAEDFVTTVIPQLVVRSREELIDVNAIIGVVGEMYAKNPGLNYVGTNSTFGLGLTPLVSRMVRNVTLNLVGTVAYTPQPPGFLSGPQDSQDPYTRGIQAFRNNSLTYSVGQYSNYDFTSTMFVRSNYAYSRIHFGSSDVSAAGAGTSLLDTTSHTFAVTPGVRLSANDTLTNGYTFSHYDQGGIGSFSTHADTIGWARTWSPSMSTLVNAGVQYLPPTSTDSGGQTFDQPGFLIPTGGISFRYTSKTEIMGDVVDATGRLAGLKPVVGVLAPGGIGSVGSYSMTLNYNYAAYPLLFLGGGLMKSHLFGTNGMYGITSQLTASGGVNFSKNTSTGGNFDFESIAGNAGLNYLVSPQLRASLAYTYTNSYGIGSSSSSTVNFLTLNRQMVMINLTYAFGGGSQFFQGGGGYFGAGGGSAIGTR